MLANIDDNMGCKLTTPQHNNVLAGRAVCNDRYQEFPEGCAAACFYGSPKLKQGLSRWQKLSMWQQRPKKIEVVQPAVSEMMAKLDAGELYREFMSAVFALIDSGVVWGWRRELLSLRMQFAPRFFALGMDVWVCKQHTGGRCGHNEYYMLFVDRNVADPASVRSVLSWRHLMWGMGTGLRQLDMAPFIQPYLRQLSADGTKATEKSSIASVASAPQDSKECFASILHPPPGYAPPPAYTESSDGFESSSILQA